MSLCQSAVLVLVGTFGKCPFAGDESIKSTQNTPTVIVFSTTAGNVVASVGLDGALLVDAPSVSSMPRISELLPSHTKSFV